MRDRTATYRDFRSTTPIAPYYTRASKDGSYTVLIVREKIVGLGYFPAVSLKDKP